MPSPGTQGISDAATCHLLSCPGSRQPEGLNCLTAVMYAKQWAHSCTPLLASLCDAGGEAGHRVMRAADGDSCWLTDLVGGCLAAHTVRCCAETVLVPKCCRREPHREEPHGQGAVSQHPHPLSVAALCQGSVEGSAQQAAGTQHTVSLRTGRPLRRACQVAEGCTASEEAQGWRCPPVGILKGDYGCQLRHLAPCTAAATASACGDGRPSS